MEGVQQEGDIADNNLSKSSSSDFSDSNEGEESETSEDRPSSIQTEYLDEEDEDDMAGELKRDPTPVTGHNVSQAQLSTSQVWAAGRSR